AGEHALRSRRAGSGLLRGRRFLEAPRRSGRGALRRRPRAHRGRRMSADSLRQRQRSLEIRGAGGNERRRRAQVAMARESHRRRAVTRLVAASGVALAGCAGAPASADRDVPALIRDPTPESHAELARVVSEWLGGAPVTLAADALADESRLIIER